MKGLLIHLALVPPKTHDLVQLDRLLAAARPDWSWPTEELRFLTRASLDFRYPGESADREEAARALDIATRLRERLLAFLQR
jgi:HEPN domain-containing protein